MWAGAKEMSNPVSSACMPSLWSRCGGAHLRADVAVLRVLGVGEAPGLRAVCARIGAACATKECDQPCLLYLHAISLVLRIGAACKSQGQVAGCKLRR